MMSGGVPALTATQRVPFEATPVRSLLVSVTPPAVQVSAVVEVQTTPPLPTAASLVPSHITSLSVAFVGVVVGATQFLPSPLLRRMPSVDVETKMPLAAAPMSIDGSATGTKA